jgi:hypothetical protein
MMSSSDPHADAGSQQPPGRDKAPPLAASLARAASSPNQPVQRLAAARVHAQRAPDGVPTLGGGNAAGRTFQRFSGSGVAPRTQVQRQERRARVTTIALIGLTVIVLIASAVLLFNPFARKPTYGFTVGTRYLTVTASVPSIVHGGSPTPTPTPTLAPTSQPGGGGTKATPTATSTRVPPTPTPTRVPPTPTPTLTPTPVPANSATVTFTRTQQALGSFATLTACDSCSFNVGAGTVQSQYISLPSNYQFWWEGYAQAANGMTVQINCINPETPSSCSVPASTVIANGNGSCTTGSAFGIPKNGSHTVACTPANSRGQVPNLTGAGVNCINSIQDQVACTVVTYSATYTVPISCYNTSLANQAQSLAGQQATNYLNGHGKPNTLQSSFPDYMDSPYCSDINCNRLSPGTSIGTYQYVMCQEVNGWRYTWTASDAPNLQQQRLSAEVPANFILDTSAGHLNVCSSPSVQSADANNRTATIDCAASGRAIYAWTAAQIQALQQALTNQTVQQATSIVKSSTGVDTGYFVTITTDNGSSVMPTDFTKITLNVQTPP